MKIEGSGSDWFFYVVWSIPFVIHFCAERVLGIASVHKNLVAYVKQCGGLDLVIILLFVCFLSSIYIS